MGKASSSKKVARAASTSGGRTSRGRAPVLWYAALLVIVLAGGGLTAFSRQERQDALGGTAGTTPPVANKDHWHVAYGVYDCDKWLDPVPQEPTDPDGIHTHGDGIIHVHPFVARASGKNAVLGRWTSLNKADIDGTSFKWPAKSGAVKRKKGDKCGDTTGVVKVFYDGKQVDDDPKDIRFTDRGKLVIAFVPAAKTLESIGDPPSTAGLDSLTDVDPSTTSTTVAGQPADPTATTATTLTTDTTGAGQPGATTTAPPATTASTTPAPAPSTSTP